MHTSTNLHLWQLQLAKVTWSPFFLLPGRLLTSKVEEASQICLQPHDLLNCYTKKEHKIGCVTHLMTASLTDRSIGPNCSHKLRTICSWNLIFSALDRWLPTVSISSKKVRRRWRGILTTLSIQYIIRVSGAQKEPSTVHRHIALPYCCHSTVYLKERCLP